MPTDLLKPIYLITIIFIQWTVEARFSIEYVMVLYGAAWPSLCGLSTKTNSKSYCEQNDPASNSQKYSSECFHDVALCQLDDDRCLHVSKRFVGRGMAALLKASVILSRRLH